MKPALLLWDIDGTLVQTGRAGLRAMTRAFEQVFGVADAFDGVAMSGRTDTWLVTLALGRHGFENTSEAHARFREAYVALLAEEIQQPGTGRKGLLPGVVPLLEAFHEHDAAHNALLTGNYRDGARVKLDYFDIWRYFGWGVFGEEASERVDLAPLVSARACSLNLPDEVRRNAIVIGDTPHDVDCGHAAGARVIGVATGTYSVDDLRASGADHVFPDLSDTDAVLRVI